MRTPRTLLAVVLIVVAVLAGLAREVHNQRVTELPRGDPSAGWFSIDPDTYYHLRRVARVLDEGLPVAGFDTRLNHPEGAPIPWPPYYTLVLAAALGPFAPDDPTQRAAFLERSAASLPLLFGTLAALVVALAAWRLVTARQLGPGPAAAAGTLAGGIFALLGSSLHYGAPGNGDHHAFATLLMVAIFALISEAARPERLASPRACAWIGAAAGVLAGGLLGSWVGGLVYVLLVQVALGWLVLRARSEALPGLAPLGLAFHLCAALVLAPAALSSPWNAGHPWIVVNLSWFHLTHLLLGAAVFAPLLVLPPGSRARRAWPWCVLALIGALALAAAGLDVGPARGIREGFAWAGRSNGFMDFIAESQPLLWGEAGSPWVAAKELGLAPLALIAAWIAAAWRVLRRREGDLLIWVAAAPVLLVQALVQRRFGDALGPTMGVLVGWGAAQLCAARWRALRPAAWVVAGLLLALALGFPSVNASVRRVASGGYRVRGPQAATYRAQRAIYRWLGARAGAPGAAVLAAWYHGHAIEWLCGRPSVATNFGSYVGVEGYLAPWRFFLEVDPLRAEALLVERDARFVLIDGGLTNDLRIMQGVLELDGDLIAKTPEGPRPAAAWYATLGAQLVFEGRAVDPRRGTASESLDFLRLVHISSEPYQLNLVLPYLPPGSGLPPCGWIWEHVPGAHLEARGTPGEELNVTLELVYPERERHLVWTRSARVGADGLARLRVPYCSDAPNGDGVASGPARWSLGARGGTIEVSERDVLQGGHVSLP